MDTSLGGNVIEILKWVGIVFLAGFIGYFGRVLAKVIIARAGRKKKPAAAADTIVSGSTPSPEVTPSVSADKSSGSPAADYKVEKKRLKAEAKRVKKAAKEKEDD